MSKLLPWLLLSTWANAQTPPGVQVSLRALAVNEAVEGLWIRNQDAWKELRVPATFMGERMAYAGPNPLTLFIRSESPEGEILHAPVATVPLSPSAAEQLLLVREDASAPGERRFQVLAVDASVARFPPGAYLLMNHTGRPVAFLFDEERLSLDVGEQRVFRPKGSGQRAIQVQFAHPGDGSDRSFVSTTWFHHERHRDLVFLFAEDGEIRIKSVRHFAERE